MQRIADELLDESFATELSGPSRDFKESGSNTSFAFLLALLLIYLILAAQFESFRDPLIILFTVPLALAGALLSLWLFDSTLNIFSEIGMIMLIGLVTKNGILIVEFANQKRKDGLAIRDAVFEASAARLRPILMTSLATILGALPIALALGAGSQSRVPLGIVVVGGLLFSLILTLLVIPAVYTYVTSKKARENDK
jgi:multidrug efflux pump subunit AcrB